MSNIIYLHRQPAPVARFLRVSEHRRVEHLLEADRLPYDRFVIEAGWLAEQQDLIAELSAIAKYAGHARNAPWANPDGILTEAHPWAAGGSARAWIAVAALRALTTQ